MFSTVPSPQNPLKIPPPAIFIDSTQKQENANAKDAYAKRIFADEEKLRDIIRKQLTLSGVQSIIQFAKDYDLSYSQLLVAMTEQYLKPAFKFWTKPSQQIKKSIDELMVTLNSKLHALALPFMLNRFQQLKRNYQYVSKRKVVLIKPQASKYETEQKARQFLNQQKDKYDNKPTMQVRTAEQQQKKSQYLIQTSNNFGANWKQSKIEAWRQIYFKIELQFEHKLKLMSTQDDRALIQKIIAQRQQLQQKKKNPLLTSQKTTTSHSVASLNSSEFKNQQNNKHQQRIISQYAIMKNIEKKYSADRDCLGCTKFFYQSDDLAFPVPKQAVTYVHSRKNMDNIWREIVGYLNSKGGIILIGCKKQNEKIVPNVEDIAEHEKEALQNKIHSLRSSIYPSIAIDKHLLVKFVPIAHDPRKFPCSAEPQWIKGAYILRLTVVALQPQLVYFYNYKVENKIINYFYRQIQGQCCKIEGPAIYDFMKKRYRIFGDNPKDSSKESKDQPRVQLKDQIKDLYLRHKDPQLPALFYHNYTCRQPEKGEQDFGSADYHPIKQRVDLKEPNPLQLNRKNFNSVSLIVMDKAALEEARHLFKDVGKHDIEIDVAFPEKQFILSNTTFLIWHNCKFEKLMQTLKSAQGQSLKSRNRKTTLLINTVKSLFIDRALTQQHRANIADQVHKQAKQNLQFKQIEATDEKHTVKHYIKCQTVITAVYLYFFITSKFKEKEKSKYKVKFDKVSANPVAETNKPNNKEGKMTYEAKPKREESRYQEKEAHQSNRRYKQASHYEEKQEEYSTYDFTKNQSDDQISQISPSQKQTYPLREQNYRKENIQTYGKQQYLQEVRSEATPQSSYTNAYVTPSAYQYPVQISQINQGNSQQPYCRIQNGYYCYYYSNGIIDYYLPNGAYYGSSYYNNV